MNGVSAVVITACAAGLIGSVVSGFVTDGGTKKILSLVLGTFTVCTMLVPVTRAVTDWHFDAKDHPSYEELISTTDEAYQQQLISAVRSNLEKTLTAILNQNGIQPQNVEVILALKEENSIIISQISIYISNRDIAQTERIRQLTEESFQISPAIIRSEDE